MFPTVLIADKFNSFIHNDEFMKALQFIKNNDVKFSHIDSNSESCFNAIEDACVEFFNERKLTNPDQSLLALEKVIIPMLEKEPQYWLKKFSKTTNEPYFFLKFFIASNNLEKIKFFNESIKKITNSEVEADYIGYRTVPVEIGEFLRNSTSSEKINCMEISDAHQGYLNEKNIDSFLSYLDNLIASKPERKITYDHAALTELCVSMAKEPEFMEIFPKIVKLYSPEIFKSYKGKGSIEDDFPFLKTRLDFLVSRIFSCMNFSQSKVGYKGVPVSKAIVLPLLSYLQEINFKSNINDYLIGEFRFRFTPCALDFVSTPENKDWPSVLGLSKDEGFDIAGKYFSNFFVQLLSDSLLRGSTFTVQDQKIERLLKYKESYPEQFEKDFQQYELGLEKLGVKQSLNSDVNSVHLYFKMLLNDEKKASNPLKAGVKKI